jgi:8-oxo-dGTP diphosphatase
MKKQIKVIISVFADGKKILVEKRFLKGYLEEQLLIPGGTVRENETSEEALKREVLEELGITVLEYELLPSDKQILGLKNQHLIPFYITKWQGDFPRIILDKGNKIEWLEIDEVIKTPFQPTKKVVEALKKYLSQ